MKYSHRQINYILKSAHRNVGDAIIKNDNVFIKDIVLTRTTGPDDIKLLFRGKPVDLSDDIKNKQRALRVLADAYGKYNRRNRVRNIFQKLSDNLTRNYKLESMTDSEIHAWFALDRVAQNIGRVKISRVGAMYNIHSNDVVFSYIPSAYPKQIYVVSFNNGRIIQIEQGKTNPYLFDKASDVFTNIYHKIILPQRVR